MGFWDDIFGGQGTQSNQTQSPAESGRSTAGTLLSGIGAVTGITPFSALGGMFNSQARTQFLEAQRPKLLKLAQDEGVIDQKKADFISGLPIEAALPDLHDINQQIFAQKASKTPTLFYNPATQQMEAHTLQEGQTYPKGLVTPGMYNAQQSQQEKQSTEAEHQREFGINKDLQERNFGATMDLRKQTLAMQQANEASNRILRELTLQNTQANQAFAHQMATSNQADKQMSAFQEQANNLAKQREDLDKLQADGKADPQVVQNAVSSYNASLNRTNALGKAYGIDTTALPAPLTTTTTPGWLSQKTGGLIGGSNFKVQEMPAGVKSALGVTGGETAAPFKAGDRRTKNGKTYQRDASGAWHPVTP